MIALEMYTRLLTELNFVYRNRDTFTTQLKLRDVLNALRDQAAKDQGLTPEHIQRSCEEHAQKCALRNGGRL